MKKVSQLFTIMFYIFIMGLVLAFLLIRYFSKNIGPMLINYGEAEARRIITLVINNSISKEAFNGIDMDRMLDIKKDSNDRIESIDFDTVEVTSMLDTITNLIQDNLNAIEDGDMQKLDIDLRRISDIDYEEIEDGIVYEIPMGSASGSGLINNVGPKIPIRLIMIGDVITNINSDIKEYGINNAMIEVKIDVSVTMLVNMSFVSKEVNIKSSIPVIMKVIQGNVPDYYMGSGSNDSAKNN